MHVSQKVGKNIFNTAFQVILFYRVHDKRLPSVYLLCKKYSYVGEFSSEGWKDPE